MRRKDVKNDKVIKAMTIGISAMMTIMSSPMVVYAEDESGGGEEENPAVSTQSQNTENTGSSESSSESVSVSDAVSICEDVNSATTNNENGNSGVEESISEAAAAVDNLTLIPPIVVTDSEGNTAEQSVADALKEIVPEDGQPSMIDNINAGIQNAEDTLKDIQDKQDNTAQPIINTGNDYVSQANDTLDKIDDANKTASDNYDQISQNADVANDVNSTEEQARQAAADAQKNFDTVTQEYAAAASMYEHAEEDLKNATSAYEAAEAVYVNAQNRLAEVKQEIQTAGQNATAATEKLKAIESQVSHAADRLEKIADKKAELQTIKDQYYLLMVHYFRDKRIDTPVYNADGTLNIEESTKKAVEQGKITDPTEKLNNAGSSISENTMIIARNLMEQLIKYKLAIEEDVDPATIQFGRADQYNRIKNAASGKLERQNGKDRTVIDEQTKHSEYWTNVSGESGRNNHVTVYYKDKDGNEVSTNYNYIFKSTNYSEDADLEKGPIYLALITQNGKNWEYNRDQSENNFDNYTTVQATLKEIDNLQKYLDAKREVKEAHEEVAALEKKLDNLNKVSVDTSALDALKKDLDEAQDRLDKAEGILKELSVKAVEAAEIMDSIDLSRFNKPAAQTPAETDEAGASEDIAAPEGTASAGTFTEYIAGAGSAEAIASAIGTGSGAALSGVAGARVDRPAGAAINSNAISPEELAAMLSAVAPTWTSQTGDNITINVEKDTDTPEYKRIEDNKVPLAATPFQKKDIDLSWGWAIIIACAGAIGMSMYEDHRRKALAAEVSRRK